MYAQDKTGRKDNDFFKHLCISNSEVGGWNLLLFLEGFFHVTVKKIFLKSATIIQYTIKGRFMSR